MEKCCYAWCWYYSFIPIIFRDFEPYLLIPIGFGILIANFPGDTDIFIKTVIDETTGEAKYSGLLGFLYTGVKTGIYPCLIFLGIGATTDFGPLIANPKSMLLGAAAQLGIFITFLVAIKLYLNLMQKKQLQLVLLVVLMVQLQS